MPENQAPLESRLLVRLQEPLAAGLYELRNASQLRRVGRGLKRYAESLEALPAATAALYPATPLNLWNLHGAAVGGFTEYFNRLSPELKKEVLRRTEYRGI